MPQGYLYKELVWSEIWMIVPKNESSISFMLGKNTVRKSTSLSASYHTTPLCYEQIFSNVYVNTPTVLYSLIVGGELMTKLNSN